MPQPPEPKHTAARSKPLKDLRAGAALLCLILAALPGLSPAQSTWNGSISTDWNTAGNWSSGVPSGVNAQINSIPANICTVRATVSALPTDIIIGDGAGTSGQINQTDGLLQTGATNSTGNWFFVGRNGGTGLYNLSGSGSLAVGKLWVGGMVYAENGTGTVTINTTGTVSANSSQDFSGWGQFANSVMVGWGDVSFDTTTTPTGFATLNLLNGTLNANAGLWIGCWGSQGTLNQTGGAINTTDFSVVRWFGQGVANITNATLNSSGSVWLAHSGAANDISQAILNVGSGATVNSESDFIVAFAGSGASGSYGQLNIAPGGTVNVGTTTKRWMIMNQWDTVPGTLNVNGGTLNLNANTDLRFSTGNGTGASTVNLNSGTITSWSGNRTGAGAGVVDLNQAGGGGANNTFNLNGGTLTIAQVTANQNSGSTVFNFNGGTLKPTGNNAVFVSGLSAVNVQSNGAIIDTANFSITIGQMLQAGVNSGGLTKVGTGTLSLAGGYSYSGTTLVQAGTLALDAAQASSGSALTVNNATLSLSLNNGGSSISAGLVTFSGSSVLNLNFGTATSPTAAAITATGVSHTGTTVINIIGQDLVVGTYPLIFTGGSVPTNGFSLGPLPTGVAAHLNNSGASLDLVITASGQNLAWYGANSSGTPLTTWDINTSSNWNSGAAKYLQYSGNSYGDNVLFDDTLFNASDANITLNANVVPASVRFNNSSVPYSIAGSGGIGGATSVILANNGSVYLGTSNSFTGGTTISSGATLSVANDSGLGAGSSPLTLAGGTLQISNSTSMARNLLVTANSTLNLAAGASVQFSGTMAGSANLTENGPGTLTLAGAGTNRSFAVGGAAGNSVMNISGTLTASNIFLANSSGAVGAVYQSGGTVTLAGGAGDCLNVGNISGGFGYYNVFPGASVNANGVAVGGENNDGTTFSGTGGDGIMDINGGNVNDLGWFVMSRGATAETGILNLFSGSASFAGGGLVCNWGSGQTAIINVLGGTLSSANQGIGLGGSGNTGILNLNGGVVAVTDIGGNFGGTFGELNFNGGTLQAVGNAVNPLRMTSANVYTNGATIDDGGYVVAISQPLLAPAGYGVASVGLSDGGSGYVAPPILTISGGAGSNATAVAQINPATGRISNILVTCPGTGYTSGDTLTVTFNGGGGSAVPPASVTVNLALNTSGGLVKKGAGTLTLSGANTFTNLTVVNSGTLSVAGAPVLHLSFDNVVGSTVINSGTGGSALNGTLNGTAVITNAGKFGNCLSISGADATAGSCRIANAVVPLAVGAGHRWTVAMWVQSTTAGGCYGYQGDGAWNSGNTVLYLNAGGTSSGTSAGGVRWGQGWETGTATVNDGNWHHVVLTYNGTTKAAYVDGALDALKTDQWGGTGTGSQFWIGGGADTGDGTANLNGLVDEVYVFDRDLSAAEVLSLYNVNSLPATPVLPGPVKVAAGATLGGNGLVGGPVTVLPGGNVAAGASIGTLTINNNLTLGGNVVAEVNTSVSPSNDLIVVSGTLTNSGTGTVTLSNLGPALVAGDSFTLFSKPLANGGAMSLTASPALASGLVLSNRLALDGSVLVVQGLPTTPTNLTYSVSGGALRLSWPPSYQGWLLQSNAVSLVSSTNWFVVPGSSTTNSMSFTLDPTKPNVFFRMRRP